MLNTSQESKACKLRRLTWLGQISYLIVASSSSTFTTVDDASIIDKFVGHICDLPTKMDLVIERNRLMQYLWFARDDRYTFGF